MEVVKLSYFPIVLYCLLASYSEALPFRSLDSKGKKHCINLKLNPSKWELRYTWKGHKSTAFSGRLNLHPLLLMILCKIVHICIFSFQSVGRVHIMGQVKVVIVWNVLFKEIMQIMQNGHGKFLYSKEETKVRIKIVFLCLQNRFLTYKN